ncbi:aminotransferase class I/II-fold pyridoxal phosphate-dependent enzyme [Nocardia sp. NPDC058058]|uniref:aminotransferase class I/II-fold pyridoxal phosphate-dependent enzyme n=1 Tax=Nocardia sp. NPDC058058 TaxID=3346317 RepID=UPI0036DA8172
MTVLPANYLTIDRFARTDDELLDHLDSFVAVIQAEEPYVLGYPGNLNFSFNRLSGLLDIFLNNVGDPGSYEIPAAGSKAMERAVVEFMTRLANGDPYDTYGYLASGGSEANQFGLDRGCTLLPEAKIYCSAAAHYSIRKSARLMRKPLVVIPCDREGRMDTEMLASICRREAGRGAVVVATIGTTMTGAVDDIPAIEAAAAGAGDVYVHADAALSGLILPFTPWREKWGFGYRHVGSVAVSMHKMLGVPVPCAVALCRRGFVNPQVEGEYVGVTDATLGCSRSGLASALSWYALASKGATGLAREAHRALDTAEYAARRLAEAGLRPALFPASIIVVFDRPEAWICRKYHLATEGDRAHIVTVPHVAEAVIDELCLDIVGSRY